MIIAVDTSSALTSAAVCDGDMVLAERSELDARRHAEVLAPLVREVVRDSGVDAREISTVACGVGPGPYTGLRVGIATARALGLAWGRPVVGVCSLDAVAAAVFHGTTRDRINVAADARRREVYWAGYTRADGRVCGPLVMSAAAIEPAERGAAWAGSGAELYADQFGEVIDIGEAGRYPYAAWIARVVHRLLADGVAVIDPRLSLSGHGGDGNETAQALLGSRLLMPEPLYLRRPDAAEPSRP